MDRFGWSQCNRIVLDLNTCRLEMKRTNAAIETLLLVKQYFGYADVLVSQSLRQSTSLANCLTVPSTFLALPTKLTRLDHLTVSNQSSCACTITISCLTSLFELRIRPVFPYRSLPTLPWLEETASAKFEAINEIACATSPIGATRGATRAYNSHRVLSLQKNTSTMSWVGSCSQGSSFVTFRTSEGRRHELVWGFPCLLIRDSTAVDWH